LCLGPGTSAWADPIDERRPENKGVDLRSHGRQTADEVRRRQATEGAVLQRGSVLTAPARQERGSWERREEDKEDGRNVQVNDPALDHVQSFPGTRPFEFSVQSETSIAAFRNNIVIGYNSSADQHLVQRGGGFVFAHVHLSGFSASHDGGRTWSSGFVPPVPGSPFTFGDPSVAVDRAGRFYYVSLGTDADPPTFTGAVIANTSTDGGASFAPARVVARDDGSDKPWLTVGRDPVDRKRDDLYVTWTSFQDSGAELRFARSTDGGVTWSPQKTLFAPVDTGPEGLSAFIQFANPTVDQSSGRLFIPFLHLGNLDTDFIKVLVSDDAGDTFTFLAFDVPGAPDKVGFPNVTPGTLSDCGAGGIRPVLSQGADLGEGRLGLPRFRQATRLITQPSAAAANGRLFIAFNSSTSPFFGDPNSRSEIRLLASPDGGRTLFGPFTVAAATDLDPQHVLPGLSVDADGKRVSVGYYVQQADGRIRVDLSTGTLGRAGRRFQATSPARLSGVAFDLIPSNNPVPSAFNAFLTTNYDRTVPPCYNLGEYIATTQQEESVLAAWGDNRNTWTSPSGSPAAGPHAQPDVFFHRTER